MCFKTRIRNTNIRGMVWVASIEDKLRENGFSWFGYVCRRHMGTDDY